MWRNSDIGKSAFGLSAKSLHACFLDNYAINAAEFAHTAPLKRIVGEVVRLVNLEIVSESRSNGATGSYSGPESPVRGNGRGTVGLISANKTRPTLMCASKI
jgi:hypothetical protein